MGKLDIAIVIIVGVGGLSCLRAGFTRSVWGIAALSAGAFIASQVWQDVTPFLLRFIKQEPLAKWISIIVIVTAVSIVIDMVFSHIQKVVERGVLGWVNHIIGGAFGVVSSAILIGCFLLLLNRFGGEEARQVVANSRFAPDLLEIARQVFDFGEEAIKEHFGPM